MPGLYDAPGSSGEPPAPGQPGASSVAPVPAYTAHEVLTRWRHLSCPACGVGEVFPTWLGMHERCKACGYRYERESGYFLGSIYFNYGVTCGALMVAFFALEWALGVGLGIQTALWVGFALTFPFWFHRFARQAFMLFDLWFAPPEPPDFQERG